MHHNPVALIQQIQVAFRVSMDLLGYLESFGSDSEEKPEGVELEENEDERKLHFKQDLLLEFNNGSSQVSK